MKLSDLARKTKRLPRLNSPSVHDGEWTSEERQSRANIRQALECLAQAAEMMEGAFFKVDTEAGQLMIGTKHGDYPISYRSMRPGKFLRRYHYMLGSFVTAGTGSFSELEAMRKDLPEPVASPEDVAAWIGERLSLEKEAVEGAGDYSFRVVSGRDAVSVYEAFPSYYAVQEDGDLRDCVGIGSCMCGSEKSQYIKPLLMRNPEKVEMWVMDRNEPYDDWDFGSEDHVAARALVWSLTDEEGNPTGERYADRLYYRPSAQAEANALFGAWCKKQGITRRHGVTNTAGSERVLVDMPMAGFKPYLDTFNYGVRPVEGADEVILMPSNKHDMVAFGERYLDTGGECSYVTVHVCALTGERTNSVFNHKGDVYCRYRCETVQWYGRTDLTSAMEYRYAGVRLKGDASSSQVQMVSTSWGPFPLEGVGLHAEGGAEKVLPLHLMNLAGTSSAAHSYPAVSVAEAAEAFGMSEGQMRSLLTIRMKELRMAAQAKEDAKWIANMDKKREREIAAKAVYEPARETVRRLAAEIERLVEDGSNTAMLEARAFAYALNHVRFQPTLSPMDVVAGDAYLNSFLQGNYDRMLRTSGYERGRRPRAEAIAEATCEPMPF